MAVQDQSWTVLRLIQWTREYFAKAGLDEPRLAAEVLLAHVLGWERIDLYARFEHEPAADELASFRELVARARRREPVAYLIGWKEFYSMRFRVTPDVLVPRPETEMLVSQAVAHLRSLGRPGRMWDACTGSGCVAIAAARHVADVSVLATDVSPAAVALAAENAAAHGLADRVRCRVADLLEVPDDCGDWREVDFLSANPPYVAEGEEVAEEVRHEPRVAVFAGVDGLEKLRELVRSAPRFLPAGGKLAMEFGEGQADAVRELIAATGAFDEPRILRDGQGIERTVVASRRGEPH
jgi:release factor glutamine methyltransferase